MIESRKERARYLREMNRSIRDVLVPELTSSKAIDVADSIDHVLALFVLEEEYGIELCRETSGRLSNLLSNIALLLERENRSGSLVDKIRSTLRCIDEMEPAGALERLKFLAQEAVLEAFPLMKKDIPELAPLVDGLVGVEREYQRRVSELMDNISKTMATTDSPVSRSGCPISAEQLTDYLRSRFPQAPNLHVKNLFLLPGGHSKETSIFELENAAGLPSHLVLRKDASFSWTNTKASDEYALLKVLSSAGGIPVPNPVLCETDESRFGGTFLVMEKAPGRQPGGYYPARRCELEDRRQLGVQLAGIFARMHSIDIHAFRGTHLNLEPDLKAALIQKINYHRERILSSDMPASYCGELACQWLLEHVDEAITPGKLSLNYNDIGLHNMLVDGTRVSALLDWELADIGVPANDLGSCRHLVGNLIPWEEFTEIYLRSGGPPSACDPKAVRYFALLTSVVASGFTGLARKLFRTGMNEFLYADAGYDNHFRSSKLLTENLAACLAGE